MKRVIYIFVLLVCCSSFSLGQMNYNGSVSIPDPNAASFAKFIDNPVNTYNGSIDVTIPVYTIENGNIKLPITLRYNTTGIKVSEEASMVGLGWNLNVGGVITQSINGIKDMDWEYDNIEIVTPSMYEPGGGDYWSWWCESSPIDIWPWELYQSIYNQMGGFLSQPSCVVEGHDATSYGKGQPDVYYFSFLDYSGKFFIDYRDESIHIMEKSGEIKFSTYEKDGFDYWKAKTPDGTWFYFDVKVNSYNHTASSNNSNSFYLTKIVFPNGKMINYEYEDFVISQSVDIENSSFAHDNDPATIVNYVLESSITNIRYETKLLSRIYSDDFNEELNFYYSDREDCNKKLDMIAVTDGNSIITKVLEFDYDYFVTSTEGNVWSDGNTGPKRKRLKLISFGETNLPKYEFQYSDIELPSRYSYAQDYWGYYNGKTDNENLLANFWSFFFLDDPPPADYLPNTVISEGFLRACDTNYVRAGSLEKIKYPTGGSMEIEYESNSFSNFKYPSVSQIQEYNDIIEAQTMSGVSHYDCNGGGCYGQIYPFDLETASKVTINYTFNWTAATFMDIDEATVKLCTRDQYNTPQEELESFAPQYDDEENICEGSCTILLDPGNYGVYSNNPEGDPYIITGVHANITIVPAEYSFPPGFLDNCYGGGIRVKSIKQVDANNSALKTRFIYSPGQLMSRLMFYFSLPENSFWYKINPINGDIIFEQFIFQYIKKSSSSLIPMSYDAAGGFVGYPEVIVQKEGSEQALELGFTKYTYNCILPGYAFCMPSVPNVLNGKPARMSKFGTEGEEKYRITYEYEQEELHRFYGLTPHWNRYWGHILRYSLLSSRINVSKITESYFDDNGTEYGKKIKDFEYNDYNMVTKVSENTSIDQKTIVTNNIHVGDLESPGVYTHMYAENMISPLLSSTTKVIENGVENDIYKITYDYAAGINYNIPEDNTTYTPFNNIEIKEYPAGSEYLYTGLIYDSKGNVLEIDKTNNFPVSYKWAYNQQYPFIVAYNIDQETLDAAVNSINPEYESFIDGLGDMIYQTNIDDWKDFNITLRDHTSLKDGLIETYTYKPCVGLTSSTDAKNMSIYYNYDGFERLSNIRDNELNILKHYDYNYAQCMTDVYPDNHHFEATGGTVNVSFNSDDVWTANESEDFLEVSPTQGNGNGSISISCSANPTSENRTGSVSISCEENNQIISITQAGIPFLSVIPTSAFFFASEGEHNIYVDANVEWQAYVNDGEFLSTVKIDEHNFIIHCQANPDEQDRSGNIAVDGGSISVIIPVTQKGKQP